MPPGGPCEIVIRRATAEQILPLRRAVLRPDRAIETAQFAGDDDPGNVHFAAWNSHAILGCATLHREPYRSEAAWRLRGMAVDEAARGRGVGAALLATVDDHVRRVHSALLWCNARLTAAPFYEKLGWKIDSAEFDIPDVGPHYVMMKRL